MDVTLERILHRYPGKRVIAAGTRDGEPVVIKYYLGWRQWPEFRRSVRGARALMDAGVPTARLRATGRLDAAGRQRLHAFAPDDVDPRAPVWFAVFEAVAADPETPWPPPADPVDPDAHRRLLATLAQHHRAGLIQNDLNWLNFIPCDGDLVAIDTDRVRRTRAARLLGRALSVAAGERHLVRLYASKSRIPEDDVAHGYAVYARERGVAVDDAGINAFLHRVRRARRRHAHAVARRALRGWKHYPQRRVADGRLHFDRRWIAEADAHAWAEYLATESPADGTVYPAGHPRAAEAGAVRVRHWSGGARRAAAAARGTWKAVVLARRLGFPVERPLVLFTNRAGGAWLVFLASHVPPLASCLASDDRIDQAYCVGELRHTLGRLEALGIGHRRWHADALGWDGERIHLLDPVGLYVDPLFPPWGARRRRARERATLAIALAPYLGTTPEAARATLMESAAPRPAIREGAPDG